MTTINFFVILIILSVNSMCIYCLYNSMNVWKWCMSGSTTENSILLSVLPRLNKIFNQSINQSKEVNMTTFFATALWWVTIWVTENWQTNELSLLVYIFNLWTCCFDSYFLGSTDAQIKLQFWFDFNFPKKVCKKCNHFRMKFILYFI